MLTLIFANAIDLSLQKKFGNVYLTDAKTIEQESSLSVHFVDVGQGDCIMINLPDNKNMIIDAGQKNEKLAVTNKVINYASKHVVQPGQKIDYMVLTHAHEDHVNFLDNLLDEFEVATIVRPPEFYNSNDDVWLSQKENETALLNGVTLKTDYNIANSDGMRRFLNRAYVEEGCQMLVTSDTIVFEGQDVNGDKYEIKFFTIDMTEYYNPTQNSLKNPNNYSPLIVLTYKNQSVAFTGDGEKEAEQMLINKYGSTLPNVDFFDLAHHGSKTGNTKEFVKKLSPQFAVVSVGNKNTYGLPDEEVFDVLEDFNPNLLKNTFSTAEFGDVVIGFDVENNKMENFAVALNKGIYLRDVQFRWWQFVLIGLILDFFLVFLIPSKGKILKNN